MRIAAGHPAEAVGEGGDLNCCHEDNTDGRGRRMRAHYASALHPLDAADPLAAHRELFVHSSEVRASLDGNSLGRPLRASVERMRAFVAEEGGGRLIRGWEERRLELPSVGGDALGDTLG
jgi:kynureninase